MPNGKDYNFLAKPDVLPTPPVDYSLSKPAKAVGEFAKTLVPKATQDEIRQQAILLGGPSGAGLGNFLGAAARGAQGLTLDANTLAKDPTGSQEWWNAAIRTGSQLLGAARILHGGGRGIPGTGPITKLPENIITGAEELRGPAVTAPNYRFRSPPSRQKYMDAFRANLAEGHDWGAHNVLKNAVSQGTYLPLTPKDLMRMGPQASRQMWGMLNPVDAEFVPTP